MISDALKNARELVTLNIACGCSQRYTKDPGFSLAQLMLCVMTLSNCPSFVEPNIISDVCTNKRVVDMLIMSMLWIEHIVCFSPVFDGIYDFCSMYTGATLEGSVKLNNNVSLPPAPLALTLDVEE